MASMIMDSCVICSKKYGFVLTTGLAIDSICIRVSYTFDTIFPRTGIAATVQGRCLIERIQRYSAVVVPESQLFLSLLLQC